MRLSSEKAPVRVVVALTIVLLSAFSLRQLYMAWVGHGVIRAIFGAIFPVIAVYLWLLRDWARKAARFCLGLALLVFFGGMILNPFFYEDYSLAYGTEWPW